MDKKYRWTLQVYWEGGWRTLWGSESRKDLIEYTDRCPKDIEFRIVDSLEEEVKARGRRH